MIFWLIKPLFGLLKLVVAAFLLISIFHVLGIYDMGMFVNDLMHIFNGLLDWFIGLIIDEIKNSLGL